MFKRILVAIDGSAASNAALKSATKLAIEQGASLTILHVIDDSIAASAFDGVYLPQADIDAYFLALRESGQNLVDKAAAYARKAGASVDPAVAHARLQTVAHAILAMARKSAADLIVLGTHGRRGVRRALMGSDAESVVRESTAPVLLLRSGVEAAKTRRGTTNAPRSSRRADMRP